MWYNRHLGFGAGWFVCIVPSVLLLGVVACLTHALEWRFCLSRLLFACAGGALFARLVCGWIGYCVMVIMGLFFNSVVVCFMIVVFCLCLYCDCFLVVVVVYCW